MAGLKIGFKTAQFGVDWPTLLATWELGDQLPVFDSAWLFDHFVGLGSDAGGSYEGWTLAAALASRTQRLRVGHLVLSNTYRHPALLAKMAATLDHIAPGRFVLGLGAGWHEAEHEMYGMRMPPAGERIDMLRSALRVIRALWSEPHGVTLDAPPYQLREATCEPPPLTPGGPPIVLGTQGARGLRIAAEFADGWNHNSGRETYVEQRYALLRHLEEFDRDPDEVEISVQLFVRGADYAAVVDDASFYVREGVRHVVIVMPAAQGPDGLTRIAEHIATPLRDTFG
jgi:alkanesulfonate monooxygenase SsuD/methylene tetrahydromethanopterin reductase-like flavin-dependent oxidoreductase (luciferase family)